MGLGSIAWMGRDDLERFIRDIVAQVAAETEKAETPVKESRPASWCQCAECNYIWGSTS